VQKHESSTVYLHQVLEAKLLGPGDLVLSVGSEFIENADAQGSTGKRRSAEAVKQDCELKAFSRLAPALKQEFPQLHLCVSVDSLYACGRFFQMCKDHDWSYVCVFKPTVLPTVWRDFQSLLPLCPENQLERTWAGGVHQVYRWVHDLSYVDSEGREWTFSAIQLTETVSSSQTGQKAIVHSWSDPEMLDSPRLLQYKGEVTVTAIFAVRNCYWGVPVVSARG